MEIKLRCHRNNLTIILQKDVNKIFEKIIRPLMSERRFKHSMNVAKSAVELAEKYGGNVKKAEIAGMLHDITKEFSNDEHLKIFSECNFNLNKSGINPKLYHSITGSLYVKKFLCIQDFDIINAIKYHTTGRKSMSLLEKIIFVADFISIDRNFEGVRLLRHYAQHNLEYTFMNCLSYLIYELIEKYAPIDANTFLAYNEAAQKRRNNFNARFSQKLV
jgi:nicotinate-nucleotide adenylyltransferase